MDERTKLISFAYEACFITRKHFRDKNLQEIAAWVAGQLEALGFGNTRELGGAWATMHQLSMDFQELDSEPASD